MKRRSLILLLGGASSGAMSVGTGAFSNVEAERGVSVNVVKDENAYLGVTVDDEGNAVQIRNQFADDLDLTVTLESADDGVGDIEVDGPATFVDDTGGDRDIEDGDGTLTPGEATHVRVGLDEAEKLSFRLSFEGTTGGASVDKTREFTLGPEDVTGRVEKVKLPGNSNKIRILTSENNGGGGGVVGVVSAKLYCEDDDGTVSSSNGFKNVPVNEKLSLGDFDDDLDGSIVAVEIKGIDGNFWKADTGAGNAVDLEAAAERDGPPPG